MPKRSQGRGMTDAQRNVLRRMVPRARYLLSDLEYQGVTLDLLEALARAGLASPIGYWHLTPKGCELRASIS